MVVLGFLKRVGDSFVVVVGGELLLRRVHLLQQWRRRIPLHLVFTFLRGDGGQRAAKQDRASLMTTAPAPGSGFGASGEWE